MPTEAGERMIRGGCCTVDRQDCALATPICGVDNSFKFCHIDLAARSLTIWQRPSVTKPERSLNPLSHSHTSQW